MLEEEKIIIYLKEKGRVELSYSELVLAGELFLHREDGPAIEWPDGSKEWYSNGLPHRIDGGPARELSNGTKEWFVNGYRHREDGPAIERLGNIQVWYRSGKRLKTIPKTILINYMKAKDLTLAHLLTDSNEIIRTSAQKYRWKI